MMCHKCGMSDCVDGDATGGACKYWAYRGRMVAICDKIMNVWGNEVAGVNNREEIRQLKNMAVELGEELRKGKELVKG